ncbi:hypothetical protein KP509_30G055800 [Ceratopteris richardii]|uniref:Uncharacterized protein n=1 Tax=Ceratopteris richardii TaxID=49495 RepID=A0A8T2R2P6_CERRI|nr:hypothetical protein KP509_30G055800 [Ceratopteris richardii]
MQCATIVDRTSHTHTSLSLSPSLSLSHARTHKYTHISCFRVATKSNSVCCAQSLHLLVARVISWLHFEGGSLYNLFVNPACANVHKAIQPYVALLFSNSEEMASSLRLACILVLFVALVVAHSAAFAADMEDKGRKLASDSSGTNEKKSSYQAKEKENEKKTYSNNKKNDNKEKKNKENKAPWR